MVALLLLLGATRLAMEMIGETIAREAMRRFDVGEVTVSESDLLDALVHGAVAAVGPALVADRRQATGIDGQAEQLVAMRHEGLGQFQGAVLVQDGPQTT